MWCGRGYRGWRVIGSLRLAASRMKVRRRTRGRAGRSGRIQGLCRHIRSCRRRWLCWRGGWWRHGTIWGAVLQNGPEDWLGRWLVGIFDGVHGSFEVMRLEGDCDLTDFGHTVFGWVFRVFLDDTLFFDGLCPVSFEETITDPFVTRAGEGFGKDTAVAERLSAVSTRSCTQGGKGCEA